MKEKMTATQIRVAATAAGFSLAKEGKRNIKRPCKACAKEANVYRNGKGIWIIACACGWREGVNKNAA